MTYLLLSLQLTLASVLLTAGVAKFFQSQQFIEAMRSSHLAEPLVAVLAVLVPGIELGLAALIVLSTPASLILAMAATTVLLTLFSAWMIWVYARGIRVDCGCFGAGRSEIGLGSIARNTVLQGAGVCGLILSVRVRSPLPAPSIWTAIAVTCVGMSAAGILTAWHSGSALVLSTAKLHEVESAGESQPGVVGEGQPEVE